MNTETQYTEPVYDIDGSDMAFSHYETHTRREWQEQDKRRWDEEARDTTRLILPIVAFLSLFIIVPLLLVFLSR